MGPPPRPALLLCDFTSPSSLGLLPIVNGPWHCCDSGGRPSCQREGGVPGFPPRCRWGRAPSSAIVLMGGLSAEAASLTAQAPGAASLLHQSSLRRGGDQ